jgi:hypothetical protein
MNGVAHASDVGDVQAVKLNAYGTRPNADKELKRKGDAIAFQELLETLHESGMLVRFADGSKLTLGADSRLLVDDFVYDAGQTASGASGKALISIPVGALRYVTGAMPKGHTTIDTPTATMILRGTNVLVDVTPLGITHLTVHEGSVSVHSKTTGQDTLVNEGDSVDITQDGIVSSSADSTGDPLVDDGFNNSNDGASGAERRRGDNGGHNNSQNSAGSGGSSGRSSGGSPGGGPGSSGG